MDQSVIMYVTERESHASSDEYGHGQDESVKYLVGCSILAVT
jgi:hypothetical protein